MAMKNKTVVLPLQLELNENTTSALERKTGGPEHLQPELKKLLESFVNLYAQGAFVIPPQDINRMSQATGKQVDTSSKIVEIVENSAGKKAGEYQFSVTIDPAMIDCLQDIAHSRGMDLPAVVEEAWQSVMMAGWIYSVPASCTQFADTEPEREFLAEFVGRNNPAGHDIVAAIKKAVK